MTQTTPSSDQPARPPVRQRVRPVAPPVAGPRQPASADKAAQAPAPTDIAPGDDQVGYCKPPKHSRFKPGYDPRRPKGRKAGTKNKASAIVAMMESPTPIRTPEGGVKTISTADAMARKLRELGLTGQLPAIAKAFELYFKALPPAAAEAAAKEAQEAQTPAELSVTDQAILAAFEEEITARAIQETKK